MFYPHLFALSNFLSGEEGQGIAEYSFLMMLISVATI